MTCVVALYAIIVCALAASGSSSPVTQDTEPNQEFSSRMAYPAAAPQEYEHLAPEPQDQQLIAEEQEQDAGPNSIIAVPRDCEDIYLFGVRTSGIYQVQPDDTGPSFDVYCDMDTDGGGWTVFQRRKDGSEDFYIDWIDYVRGFGNLNGEFWLGLRNIHRLTASATNSQLRVDMEDFESNEAYAKYNSFNIGDATSKYTLTVAGYSGTAGDSLIAAHNGMPFSTKDNDNDRSSGNCAVTYKGAWWYNNCHQSNLNGLYLGGPTASYADSVVWFAWKGYYYSLKFTEMKIRPN